ncbi:MAG: hypothetical protein HKP27_03870 [Myxococcales bacterium]|nr:hypothetical protein [Myxococcales bacterium]
MKGEPRYQLAIPIPVRLERADGSASTEYAVNLSAGGMCLHLREPMDPDEKLVLRFRVPGIDVLVATRACVVWSQEVKVDALGGLHIETGLRFEGLDPNTRRQIFEFASRPSEAGR